MEARKFTVAVFIDVSKAFDCVDHAILLEKLHVIGIRGSLFDLISSFLFARRQKVVCQEITSHERHVRSGVPQGSCLSSLLFLTFINDFLDLRLKGYAQLYADDALLIYSNDDIESLFASINEDLVKINEWFVDNLLSFNAQKTKYLLITPRMKQVPTLPAIMVKGIEIERVRHYRYLGLVIDEHLVWDEHIESVKRRIRPFLAMLRKSSYLLPNETKLSVYYAHVHCHLTYMNAIYGAASSNLINDLRMIQNKAIRYVFWNEYRQDDISTNDLYRRHKVLKVDDMVTYEYVMTMFKIRHGLTRVNFDLPTTGDLHSYDTRRRSHFQVPTSRTNVSRSSVFHEGVNRFNQLPDSVRRSHNLPQFKRLLKQYLSRDY